MSKILPIKIYGCPTLRQKSRELTLDELGDPNMTRLFLDMEKTMFKKDGSGLAAPQIGENIRVVAINTKDGAMVLINPKIMKKSWRKDLMEEGCLSLPGVFGLVKRSSKLTVTALDRNGKHIKFIAVGFFARVIQHEIDHLDGILFIDRSKKLTSGTDELDKLLKVGHE